MTARTSALQNRPDPARFTWPRTVALHLTPGLLGMAVFAATAPLLAHAGLPPVWGMMLATITVVVPLELTLVRKAALRRTGQARLAAILDLRRPTRRQLLTVLVPTLLCAALAPGLVQWAEAPLHRLLSGRLPAWYSVAPGSGAPPVATVTTIGWLVIFVVVGPVVEELYFRGWLLHRLPGPRWSAPLLNAGLFAVYHLWQPHAVLTVFVFAVPLAYAAQRPRGLLIAMTVHVAVNAIAFAALAGNVMHR